MTYEDKPFEYDNWELQDYYREKFWPVDDLICAEVVENGPFRYALKLEWQYQDSIITEILYFYANTPRVDIRFSTDWKEDQILLKALFPVELNTTEATFEIQYGNVKRSTAVNTSWDQARFEVCHHKWMDVSEGGYGVSFLNDCKYGVSVEENVVGLSLLKCGKYPNPHADREYHEAVYSVFPHSGSWQEAGTVQEAYLLNNPLRAYGSHSGSNALPQRYSLVEHNHRNIMIECVKKAEDGLDTIIRLYEFENRRTDVHLHLHQKAARIWLCNLLEEQEVLLAENSQDFVVPAEPFGIVTIRVEPSV
jgi:alpha-mannosidase